MDDVAGREDTAMVGVDVLGLVTSGMYIDPLTVYREYVQNAVDAIQSAGIGSDGLVEISILARERRVAIRDNGPGLSLPEAERVLVPIAKSEKRGRGLRGFRGVGRLAGLAFAEAITFLTRSGADEPVVRVVWDGGKLNTGVESGDRLANVVGRAVSVDTVDGEGYPPHFFEARLDGVSRHAAGSIMNRNAVRRYIGEVCPVPFSGDFRHAARILAPFETADRPFTVDVRLDGEDASIERPHGCSVKISEQEGQDIVEIEEIRITGVGARECAAIGWIAHTPYRGAIAKTCGVRGIRARIGNMQIGGENVFEHLFSEDRFNRWCMVEIHVLDPAIVPNARRDYFEPGVHLRNLENQLGAVCRRLEKRCRTASKERLTERRLGEFLEKAEGTLELVSSGYLDTATARKLIKTKILETTDWSERRSTFAGDETLTATLNEVAERLNSMEARVGTREIPGVGMTDVHVYREVFGVLAEILDRPELAKHTIETVLGRIQERRAGAVRSMLSETRSEAGRSGTA